MGHLETPAVIHTFKHPCNKHTERNNEWPKPMEASHSITSTCNRREWCQENLPAWSQTDIDFTFVYEIQTFTFFCLESSNMFFYFSKLRSINQSFVSSGYWQTLNYKCAFLLWPVGGSKSPAISVFQSLAHEENHNIKKSFSWMLMFIPFFD